MTAEFYRAFEDRYRGSRELIKSRQRVYCPFIEPLTRGGDSYSALDIGCGRGEWLEILLEHGFTAKGVDLDEGMLEACKLLSLPVEHADALVTLRGAGDESLALVTGFHIAEHLPFPVLQDLIREALRVLKPGGLLILETPNAENLVVGTNNFYLDPTHERPIPHLLLSFLVEYSGFARNKLLRLQESRELLEIVDIDILSVIEGASPDYAIIAQKGGPEHILSAFDAAFAQDYGLSLHVLAEKYQQTIDRKQKAIDQTQTILEQKQVAVELKVVDLVASIGGLEDGVGELNGFVGSTKDQLLDLINRLQQAESEAERLKAELAGRTKVLEEALGQLSIRTELLERALQQRNISKAEKVLRDTIRPFFARSMRQVLENDSLRRPVNQFIRKFPRLHQHLKSFAQHRGLIQVVSVPAAFIRPELKAGTLLKISPDVMPDRPRLPASLYLRVEAAALPFSQVRMTGHIEGHYSLAIINRGVAIALAEQVQGGLQFIPCHGEVYDNPIDIPANQKSILATVGHPLNADALNDTLSLVHHYPMINDQAAAGMRFVLFFWEETAVPYTTVVYLNENFDGIVVATDFVKRALVNSGCRVPVFVCPVGVDHLIDADVQPIDNLAPAVGKKFRFLHVSSVFERKGPDVLLAAYFEEFTAQDDVELYIKTFPNPHNRIHDLITELGQGRDNLPTVIVDENQADEQTMLGLYKAAQAIVLPTRGEGFNLPAAEAMAMGLPVIVTGHGAHTDFCTHATAALIPFCFAKSNSHLQSANSCWVEPDVQGLALQMRETCRQINSNDEGLKSRVATALRHVRGVYTWEKSAKAVLASAAWLRAYKEEKANTAAKPIRLSVLGPWATRCGVAEYTQSLLSEFSPADYQIKVFCDQRTPPDRNQDIYHPTWQLGETSMVHDTLTRFGAECDVLLVQHQPSLFRLDDDLCLQLARLRKQGVVVILELHSTIPLVAEHRISEKGVHALATLDRVIVHKPEDLNNLLMLGLCANVLMMGLGVLQPLPEGSSQGVRAELGIGEHDLIISCFGFILPHKGIDTLIESINALTAASGRRVHMLGLHSILDDRSRHTLEAYQVRAAQLGVESNITWITDYLPINDCLRLMSAADYVIFPYKETLESASAAVTVGLATLKPVLVSPIHIFSDLADATWRMNGSRADDIVHAIMDLEQNPQLAAELVARQSNWIEERSWKRLSVQLDNVVNSLLFERRLAKDLTLTPACVSVESVVQAAPKLFVDVSELYFRDARSGIQRVVKNVINELQTSESGRYVVVPVFGVSGKGYRYASRFAGAHEFVARKNEAPIEFAKGDTFLGLDLSAHLFPEFEAELARMRRAHVKINFVVYDLIPLIHPELAYPGIAPAFVNWMGSLGKYADNLFAISDAVAADVRKWLVEQRQHQVLPNISYFHLGADILQGGLEASDDKEQFARLLGAGAQRPSFLMVGTLEPRKGYLQALNAFEVLWAQGVEANLVIVGKEGWAVEELVSRLRNHPMLSQRLFWLTGLSDEGLAAMYTHSSCLIAASEAEGFGLPLIEAAQWELPIIARDIPVFREVAGSHACYFQGGGADDLASVIKQWLKDFEAGSHPVSGAMPWLRWEESVRQLKGLLFHNIQSNK